MTTASTAPKLPIEQTILDDRPCTSCGYNLKGLTTGSNCPECGTQIRGSKRRGDDDMGDAPRAYLATLRIGFMILGLAGLAIFLAVLSLMIDFATAAKGSIVRSVVIGPSGAGAAARALLFPVGAIGWSIGMSIVVIPRPGTEGHPRQVNGKTEWTTLRTMVRIGGFALSAGIILNVIAGLTGIPGLGWFSVPVMLLGLCGLIAMCVYLSNLAHWASDSHIAIHLMYTAVLIGIFAPLGALLFTDFRIILGILAFPIIFCALGSAAYLMYLVLKMSSMVTWSMRNAKERVERDERLAEKARQSAADAARTPPTVGVPDEADPDLLATVERQHQAMEAAADRHEGREEDERDPSEKKYPGHRVDDSGADPYALEDD